MPKDSSKEKADQVASKAQEHEEDVSAESDDSDEEDDDLILEGVLVRNPDVSDSDDSSSSDDEDEPVKAPPSKKQKAETKKQQDPRSEDKQGKKKKKKKAKDGPDIVNVDFIFCDMADKYFHGLKTLLTSTSPIYAAHSSGLADMMIQNVAVGTVVSTEGDTDGTIFGYASVLNVTTFQKEPEIQALKKICLEKCPAAHKAELEVVLSGKTKRPAGFYLQGRMVNLPLEIVEILHQQLVLDMDWAVKNAQGVDRKSLDFGAFVRIAPAYKASGVTYFKYFDDEIFAQHAEFTFEIELPKTFGMEEAPFCVVSVLTKTGHRDGMNSLTQMVNGAGAIE